MTDPVSLLFIAMIPIDCKITKFSLHLLLKGVNNPRVVKTNGSCLLKMASGDEV